MISDHEAIRHTLSRSGHCLDDKDFAGFVECFVEDGFLEDAQGDTHEGREAIGNYYAADTHADRWRGIHLLGEPDIVMSSSDGTATVETDVVKIDLKAGALSLIASGRFHDVFVKQDDGWRVARRRAEIIARSASPES